MGTSGKLYVGKVPNKALTNKDRGDRRLSLKRDRVPPGYASDYVPMRQRRESIFWVLIEWVVGLFRKGQ